jgi:hypothetical protein
LGGSAIDVPFFARWAVNAQRSLEEWAKLCAARAYCRNAFPKCERQFGELVKAWDAHAVQIRTGVTMTSIQLASVVHNLLAERREDRRCTSSREANVTRNTTLPR